jgi:chorismate-pyruvate lyase
MLRFAGGLLTALLFATTAVAQEQQNWQDSFVSRLEALALLQSLNADLLSHDSATLVLDRWCQSHHIASAQIVAERDKDAHKDPTLEQLARLKVKSGEAVRYRNVKLRCGDHVLSEADNWYAPDRLTSDMNQALDNSDISFGRVVAPLHFQRHTLAADLLWQPLPEGWETSASIPTRGDGNLAIPDHVLQHRAVLTRADGLPFSEVVETYTGEVLDFAPPRAR